jgi:hypothetical protein
MNIIAPAFSGICSVTKAIVFNNDATIPYFTPFYKYKRIGDHVSDLLGIPMGGSPLATQTKK